MKTMPIGLDDFKTVKEKYYYVDKTPFIKEFLDNHAQGTVITRPRHALLFFLCRRKKQGHKRL